MSHGYTLNTDGSINSPYSLDCSPQCMEHETCRQSKKEKKMNRVNIEDISVNIEAKAQATDEGQREYLGARLAHTWSEKSVALYKQYGLKEDDRPETPKELIDRITSGKYVLPSDEDQRKMSYWGQSILSQITWRDPAVKQDQAGYDAAKAVLEQMYENAKDDIRIQSPTDGLVTLRKFRDAPVTVATTTA